MQGHPDKWTAVHPARHTDSGKLLDTWTSTHPARHRASCTSSQTDGQMPTQLHTHLLHAIPQLPPKGRVLPQRPRSKTQQFHTPPLPHSWAGSDPWAPPLSACPSVHALSVCPSLCLSPTLESVLQAQSWVQTHRRGCGEIDTRTAWRGAPKGLILPTEAGGVGTGQGRDVKLLVFRVWPLGQKAHFWGHLC